MTHFQMELKLNSAFIKTAAALLVIAALNTGCIKRAPFAAVTLPSKTVTTTTLPAVFSDGAVLYSTHCASCHLPLAQSLVRNRTAPEIRAAISLVNGPMTGLGFLTDEQVSSIAEALRDNSNVESTFEYMPTIGTRFYVQSLLNEVFVPDENPIAADTTNATNINNLVGNNVDAFGQSCSRYDTCKSREASIETLMSAPMNSNGDPIRFGFQTRICEEVLSNSDRALTVALGKISLNVDSARNAQNVTALLNHFLKSKPLPQTVVANLVQVGSAAQGMGMNSADQWRFIMLAICRSTAFGGI